MSDQFVGEIRIMGCNFAPRGWAFCNGQLLPISQNTGLYSILGTVYGGDGKFTFALPNLQGSAAMHPGQGPGLSNRDLGEPGGSESVTLLVSEIPMHVHTANAKIAGGTASPSDMVWGTSRATKVVANFYAPAGGSTVAMNASALAPTGGSLPHNNMMPYLALNFCIALEGIVPQRP
jgi:microcystin-dependent protein